MPTTRPTLAVAKRLFSRRNPGVPFRAEWERKPTSYTDFDGHPACSGLVRFTAEGYKPSVMRLYSTREGISLF